MELDNNYASLDDLLRDAQDYMAVLDFNVNTPAEHANVESVDGDPEIKPLLRQISNITRKDLLMLQASRRFLVWRSLAREGSPGESTAGSILTFSGAVLYAGTHSGTIRNSGAK